MPFLTILISLFSRIRKISFRHFVPRTFLGFLANFCPKNLPKMGKCLLLALAHARPNIGCMDRATVWKRGPLPRPTPDVECLPQSLKFSSQHLFSSHPLFPARRTGLRNPLSPPPPFVKFSLGLTTLASPSSLLTPLPRVSHTVFVGHKSQTGADVISLLMLRVRPSPPPTFRRFSGHVFSLHKSAEWFAFHWFIHSPKDSCKAPHRFHKV